MNNQSVAADESSLAPSVLEKPVKEGFLHPQLPADLEAVPVLPDLPMKSTSDPHAAVPASSLLKPIVELRRNQSVVAKSHVKKTYKDLFHDKFVVNFAGNMNGYGVDTFIEKCQKALQADNESVFIQMSSGGGNMDEGVRIYEQLRMMAAVKQVDVLVSGLCYSACVWAIMALPIEHRWISLNSRVMIHPAQSNNADGQHVPRHELNEFDRMQLDRYNYRWIVDEISRGSCIQRSDLKRMVDEDGQDVCFSADQAVWLGLFAGIV